MFNFVKDLTAELAEYPLTKKFLTKKLEIESFCFYVGKLHHELVRMPEENAQAILGHFDSLRELLDFYAAAQELRPVLPPVEPVEPVQDAVKLRTVYLWQQAEDADNKAQLPDDHKSGALVFNLENVHEEGALHSVLIKRIAARRVPAFCFALDYATPNGTHACTSGEVWRCLPGSLENVLELSTERVPAVYKLMGTAPANRAAQVFAAEYLAPMGQLKRIDLDI
jgi:hypothetical protein